MKNIKFSGVAWKGDEGFYYSTYDVPAGESRLTYKTIHHSLYYHKSARLSRRISLFLAEKKNLIGI